MTNAPRQCEVLTIKETENGGYRDAMLSAQFFYKLKTALKKKVHQLKKENFRKEKKKTKKSSDFLGENFPNTKLRLHYCSWQQLVAFFPFTGKRLQLHLSFCPKSTKQ